jgi:hypothetical protein
LLALRLWLLFKLPEEIRELDEGVRIPVTVRLFCPGELPGIREDEPAGDPPGLRLKVEGRIWGPAFREPEGTAFCSPGFLRVGLMSGCRACNVRLPRRDASVRLRATFDI